MPRALSDPWPQVSVHPATPHRHHSRASPPHTPGAHTPGAHSRTSGSRTPRHGTFGRSGANTPSSVASYNLRPGTRFPGSSGSSVASRGGSGDEADCDREGEYDGQPHIYEDEEADTLCAYSACACCVPPGLAGLSHSASASSFDDHLILAPPVPPYYHDGAHPSAYGQPYHYPNHHYSHHPSPQSPTSPPPRPSLTRLLHSAVKRYLLPLLPASLQEIAHNPPDLSRPATLVPLLKAVAPYTQFLIVLLALYVVWAVVAGVVGYAARFVRFCFRIGPVIALIAWIMAASGQGGIDVLFEALKEYAGLGDGQNANRPAAAGRQRHAPHQYAGYGGTPRKPRSRRASDWRKKEDAQPDILGAIFGNPATGQEGLGAQVQDYVRAAVTKGLGLDWLLAPQEKKEEEKKRTR